MKNSIFTIALLLGTGITFAQETPTTEILKTRTKSNQCNERVVIQANSNSASSPSINNIETVAALITRTKSNNTNERVVIQDDSKLVTKDSIIEIETVDALKTRTKSNNANERAGSSNVVAPDAVLTSEKKHTKTGHVTLLK